MLGNLATSLENVGTVGTALWETLEPENMGFGAAPMAEDTKAFGYWQLVKTHTIQIQSKVFTKLLLCLDVAALPMPLRFWRCSPSCGPRCPCCFRPTPATLQRGQTTTIEAIAMHETVSPARWCATERDGRGGCWAAALE